MGGTERVNMAQSKYDKRGPLSRYAPATLHEALDSVVRHMIEENEDVGIVDVMDPNSGEWLATIRVEI